MFFFQRGELTTPFRQRGDGRGAKMHWTSVIRQPDRIAADTMLAARRAPDQRAVARIEFLHPVRRLDNSGPDMASRPMSLMTT